MSECFKVIGRGQVRRRRYDKRRYLLILLLFITVFTFVFLRNHQQEKVVEAADLAKFDPGFIISDYQMSNYTSMTEAEIQKFLTAKNPCNNRDEGAYQELVAKYPNIKWHFENGHFICLSEEKFGDGEVIGRGETAAHIIWQAAQDYKINPQVIIVLLQKEQGLITDNYPNSRQYRAATGYGCPDTAACSSKYYGFKNQVRNAASLFRTVLNGGWTNYPLGNNYIQYNPNAACGGSVVNVRNLATSSLYRYTPYQPNAAALAAGYGTASCGAYGNRNFYLYFEDWFGGITDEYTDNQYIYDRWIKIGGENGVLGGRVSSARVLDEGGVFQKFEKGRIYYKEGLGAWEIKGKIYERWFELGTEWGELGYPASSERKDKNGIFYQQFEKGRIYYKSGKTWVVPKWAEERYEEMGASNSVLKMSTSNGKCGIAKNGCYQNYEIGRMYYTPKTGAWDISGKIYARWFELGTEWGELGYPTSSEQKDKNGVVYQQFENGRIYYKEGKTWVIPKWAEERYEEMGASNSVLKMSTSDGKCGIVNDGCYQNYEIGRMYYTPKTGAWDISGKIYARWFELGTEWGELGYPTSSEQKDKNGVVYQQFENGRIYYKDGKTWVKMNS